MKIVVFCIIKLIYIAIASSQSVPVSYVCEYVGVSFRPAFDIPFSISDVPERCKLVTYGCYYFDATDDKPMYEHDEDAIKSLVKAGIPVYTYVGYNDTKNFSWSGIVDPQDQTLYNQLICPLIEKIKELELTGIILYIVDLYDGTPDFAHKICAFVNKLKKQVPDLKFGLDIYPFRNEGYTKIPDKELFDYTITNSVIDLYFIDANIRDSNCTPEISQSGTIITCSDKSVRSFELLSDVISQSTMDPTKTIICVIIFPLAPMSFDVFTPYSQYCNTPEAANSTEWCLDDLQRLYDIGAYTKDHFGGVAVDWMEYDDVQGLCGCKQKFPVTNTIFDGWDRTPITPCEKLN